MKRRIPRHLLLELTLSMLRRERRSPYADASGLIASLEPPPIINGREHIPAGGGFTTVANHYQRRDLWIGWGGSLLMRACGREIHWLVLRELRIAGRELPLTRRLLTRVSRTYGFIPIPADLADHAGQAAGIRQAIRCLRAGEITGFFPEGEHGHTRGITPALPGTAELAVLLSRYGPLLPAALWEEGERLACGFGPAFHLERPDAAELMDRIADVLP